MTVCFFSAQYLPTPGGVERYTANLARELVRMGHRAVVVTSALPGLPVHEETDGISIYRLPSFLLLHGRLPVVHGGAATRRLTRSLAQEKIDRVVVQTRFYPLSLFGTHFARKRHLPCIVIEHGSAHLTLGNAVLGAVVHLYEHIFMKLVRTQCHHFYAVSAAAANFLKHFGVTAEGTLCNAVNPAAFEAHADDKDWRAALQLPADAALACFVGRLVPEKGVQALLQAMNTETVQNAHVHLAVVGDGPLRGALEAMATKNTVLLGNLPHEEVTALLRAADMTVLPSDSEGFATVLLEAAACNCYIIATKVGGACELVTDADSGTLLPDATPSTIANAMAKAAQNVPARCAAVARCKENLSAHYTWDKVAQTLLSLPWK